MPDEGQMLEIWVGGMRCGKTTAWLRAYVRQLEEENSRLRQIIADVRRLVATVEPDNAEVRG